MKVAIVQIMSLAGLLVSSQLSMALTQGQLAQGNRLIADIKSGALASDAARQKAQKMAPYISSHQREELEIVAAQKGIPDIFNPAPAVMTTTAPAITTPQVIAEKPKNVIAPTQQPLTQPMTVKAPEKTIPAAEEQANAVKEVQKKHYAQALHDLHEQRWTMMPDELSKTFSVLEKQFKGYEIPGGVERIEILSAITNGSAYLERINKIRNEIEAVYADYKKTSPLTLDKKQSYLDRIQALQGKLADANLDNIPSTAKVSGAMSAAQELLEKYEKEIEKAPTEAYELSTETGAVLEKQPSSFLEELSKPRTLKSAELRGQKPVELKVALLAEIGNKPTLKPVGVGDLAKTIHDLYTDIMNRTITKNDIPALEAKLVVIDQKLSIVPSGGQKELAEQLSVDAKKELEALKEYVKPESSKVSIPVKTIVPKALIREMLDLHTELRRAASQQRQNLKKLSDSEWNAFKKRLDENQKSLDTAKKEDAGSLKKAAESFRNELSDKGFLSLSLQELQNDTSELLYGYLLNVNYEKVEPQKTQEIPAIQSKPKETGQPKVTPTTSKVPEKTVDTSVAEFAKLVERSDAFSQRIGGFPTTNNRIKVIAQGDSAKQAEIVKQAQNTYPLVDPRVMTLIDDFLSYKKIHGTTKEKNLYATINNRVQFIDRLLSKRPLAFLTDKDSYLLRDGKTEADGGFEAIGTIDEKFPLVLKDYLSYHEMQIAALLGVSVPTYFINNGWRAINSGNDGKLGDPGTYEPSGIYVGLVGARFEKPGLMEWRHMIITKEQNTTENGYGLHADMKNNPYLALWSKFYGLTFPTFDEAVKDTSGRYIALGNQYFDGAVYKERMRAVIEPFLLDAQRRGIAANKKAYVHAVGLGLGVWEKTPQQAVLMLAVYADIIKSNNLSMIADIDFSWFPDTANSCGGVTNGGMFKTATNNITIHFSKRNPADLLQGADAGKLLVASYAWDGNSYPGNEYWKRLLHASGDPAAACCSTIPELQNPEINHFTQSKPKETAQTQPAPMVIPVQQLPAVQELHRHIAESNNPAYAFKALLAEINLWYGLSTDPEFTIKPDEYFELAQKIQKFLDSPNHNKSELIDLKFPIQNNLQIIANKATTGDHPKVVIDKVWAEQDRLEKFIDTLIKKLNK
jgi:uncharacterized protein DUF4804